LSAVAPIAIGAKAEERYKKGTRDKAQERFKIEGRKRRKSSKKGK
jgi:hypothetical protein